MGSRLSIRRSSVIICKKKTTKRSHVSRSARSTPSENRGERSVDRDSKMSADRDEPSDGSNPVHSQDQLGNEQTKDHNLEGGASAESVPDPREEPVLTTKEDCCVICLENCENPKKLDLCGHIFCTACIDQYFQNVKPQCPCCFVVYGEIRGNQPENGKMWTKRTRHRLPGFKDNSIGTIEVYYHFPDGIQGKEHPNPGQPYHGTTRQAFLPDNDEGRHVLKLLRRAFDLRQTFTIGQSRTTGCDNVVTWNDIHHKTWYSGGPENFGYPDDTYLNRVRQELAAKGIK